MKRLSDIVVSLLFLLILSPIFLLIFILVTISSPGNAIYRQVRVGKAQKEFTIYKFRSMTIEQEKESSLLTLGEKDSRITGVGYWLRKYKIDELPQLWNILTGTMSFVGPRPEVKKYVDLYTTEQLGIFDVQPGLTDYASIKYAEESNLLLNSNNPEKYYIEEIMPNKLALNLYYVKNRSLMMDLKILFATFFRIIKIQ